MVKLNLGCGIGLLSGFINVDACFTLDDLVEGIKTQKGPYRNAIIQPGAKFVQADVRNMPFEDDYADYVLLNNVIEHLPMKDVIPALAEIHRVMKPGAELVVVTPDFNCLARLWVDNIANNMGKIQDFTLYHYLAEVIYGNQVGVGEYHSVPMTPDYLRLVLMSAGFGEPCVEVYPLHQDVPRNIDGVEFSEKAVNRTDNLVARVRKAPAALQAHAGERLNVKAGLA